jgi:uncharacterized RmlC-like cupin family protein
MAFAQPLSLQMLVGDVDKFARECWGQRPMVRHTDQRFDELLSVDDVEDCIDGALRRPGFRMVRDGESLPDEAVTMRMRLGGRDIHDVADPERVAHAFAQGATVVLQGLDRFWQPMITFAAAIEAELGHPVQVNAYLSPPDAKGLGEHTDEHDVLVLQTEGRKRWWVDGLGDIELRPGSVVYVPADTLHRAHTDRDASLHLTVGIFPITMRQVVQRSLREIVELDRPLPPVTATTAVEATLADALRAAAESLSSREVRTVAAGAFAGSLAGRRRPTRGQLRSLVALPDLDGATTIRFRAGVALEADDDGITMRTKTGELHVPPLAVPAVEAVAKGAVMRVDELPGLDPESQLVLARRLVRERLAVIVP